MAACAAGVGAMLGQALADGQTGGYGGFLQDRHVGRRRWRRRAEHVFEDPLAAKHWRGPRGVGSHRQNAPLPQQAAALALAAQIDAAKTTVIDMRKAIVPGEALV